MRVFNPVNQVAAFVVACLLCSAVPAAAQQSQDATDFSGYYNLTCIYAAYELALHVSSVGNGYTQEEGDIVWTIPIPCGEEAESTREVDEGLAELTVQCLELGLPESVCDSMVGMIDGGFDTLGYVIPTSVTATVRDDESFINRFWGWYAVDVVFHRPYMDDLATLVFISNNDGSDHGHFYQGLGVPLPIFPLPFCLPFVAAYADGQIDRDAGFALEGSFRAELSALCPMGIHDEPERAYFGNLSIALTSNVTGERCEEPDCVPPVVVEDETDSGGGELATPEEPAATPEEPAATPAEPTTPAEPAIP